MKVPSYNKENRKKTTGGFTLLPKGNYVCKILSIEEGKDKHGHTGVRIFFDIAEGEYKDFYSNKYKDDDREDKKWANDATYWLGVPYDDCPGYVQDGWDSFWANVEDSNNGYVFDGNEKTVKGKTFGGIFRNEQSEYKDNVYDHTKLFRTCIAQDIRDGKVTWVPKDKLVPGGVNADFSSAPVDDSDLPF